MGKCCRTPRRTHAGLPDHLQATVPSTQLCICPRGGPVAQSMTSVHFQLVTQLFSLLRFVYVEAETQAPEPTTDTDKASTQPPSAGDQDALSPSGTARVLLGHDTGTQRRQQESWSPKPEQTLRGHWTLTAPRERCPTGHLKRLWGDTAEVGRKRETESSAPCPGRKEGEQARDAKKS